MKRKRNKKFMEHFRNNNGDSDKRENAHRNPTRRNATPEYNISPFVGSVEHFFMRDNPHDVLKDIPRNVGISKEKGNKKTPDREGFTEGFSLGDFTNVFTGGGSGSISGTLGGGGSLDIVGQIKGFFQDLTDKINNGFDKMDNFFNNFGTILNDNVTAPITGAVQQSENAITGEIGDIKNQIQPMLQFVVEAENYIANLKSRFQTLGHSFEEIGDAFEMSFNNLGRSIKTEFTDIGDILNGGASCLVHFFNNFRSCLIYWILDLIGEIIYSIFVLFPVWFIETVSGYSLQGYLDTMNGYIENADAIVVETFGFSVVHYPESILDDCYRCKVNFNQLVKKINDDNNVNIPRWMNEPQAKFRQGGHDFISAFNR